LTDHFHPPAGVTGLMALAAAVFLLTLTACGPGLNKHRLDAGDLTGTNVRVLFGGDFAFGDTYEEGRKIIERYGHGHGMKNLAPLLNRSDFSMVNLETPLTSVDIRPYRALKKWVHRGHPDAYARLLKEYRIHAVALANNHATDCGTEGLLETIRVLDKASVLRTGAGGDAREAARPLIREIAVGNDLIRLAVFAAYEDDRIIGAEPDWPFASEEKPGVNLLASESVFQGIKAFKEKNPKGLAVVFPHWGANYSWKSPAQTERARQLIDAGADIVIGHGAHMLQEIENYQGRWIIYSLGNFVFNTPGRYAKNNAWPYSAVAFLIFAANQDGRSVRVRLYPIVTDNLATGYQPRAVEENEFNTVVEVLREKSARAPAPQRSLTTGKDEMGFYLEGDVL